MIGSGNITFTYPKIFPQRIICFTGVKGNIVKSWSPDLLPIVNELTLYSTRHVILPPKEDRDEAANTGEDNDQHKDYRPDRLRSMVGMFMSRVRFCTCIILLILSGLTSAFSLVTYHVDREVKT